MEVGSLICESAKAANCILKHENSWRWANVRLLQLVCLLYSCFLLRSVCALFSRCKMLNGADIYYAIRNMILTLADCTFKSALKWNCTSTPSAIGYVSLETMLSRSWCAPMRRWDDETTRMNREPSNKLFTAIASLLNKCEYVGVCWFDNTLHVGMVVDGVRRMKSIGSVRHSIIITMFIAFCASINYEIHFERFIFITYHSELLLVVLIVFCLPNSSLCRIAYSCLLAIRGSVIQDRERVFQKRSSKYKYQITGWRTIVCSSNMTPPFRPAHASHSHNL